MNVTHRSVGPRQQVLVRSLVVHPFTLWLLVALTLLLMSVPRLRAQDLLASARTLYESAAYDEALTTLQRLSADRTALPTAMIRAVEEYRFLCLVALGRLPEARESMAAVVTADPLYTLDAGSTSPRILSAFEEVRREMLPSLTEALYEEAKLAYGRKEYTSAEAGFKTVMSLLDDPDMAGKRPDLPALVRGFLDLTSTALTAALAPSPATRLPAPAAPPPPVKRAVLTPPVAIRQVVPPMPPDIARFGQLRTGVLEITIDETGKVENAVFTQGIHPLYDTQVILATRTWRYQPATTDGVPTKFIKTIRVTMTPPQK